MMEKQRLATKVVSFKDGQKETQTKSERGTGKETEYQWDNDRLLPKRKTQMCVRMLSFYSDLND